MTVWRLILHHEKQFIEQAIQWSRREGFVAIGWGRMGDLRGVPLRTVEELTQVVARCHPHETRSNHVHGGRSLWRFFKEMKKGDLIILSTGGGRVQTMRVTGGYYFVDHEHPRYEHRRPAEPVGIDPDRLWRAAGGMAPGQMIYSTLIRCARELSDADLNSLV